MAGFALEVDVRDAVRTGDPDRTRSYAHPGRHAATAPDPVQDLAHTVSLRIDGQEGGMTASRARRSINGQSRT